MVNLTISHDNYEPHPFGGAVLTSLQSLSESVRVYLSWRGIELCDQVEEVLSKLRGKAQDVVKIGLCSQPSLDLGSGPQPLFHILIQHFGDSVTSFKPLANLYDTQPFPTETAVDLWIRLNKAIYNAVAGIKRQGITLGNPSREVTVMLISHCPDPELSLLFSCKPLEKWTASDVYVWVNEHRRKRHLHQHQPAVPADSLQPTQVGRIRQSNVQTAAPSHTSDLCNWLTVSK